MSSLFYGEKTITLVSHLRLGRKDLIGNFHDILRRPLSKAGRNFMAKLININGAFHDLYPLDRMQLCILGGARANRTQVLKVAMLLGSPLKATVEQPSHDLLIVGNMTITIQPKDMSLAGGMFVGDGKGRMAHGSILWIVLESQSSIRMPTPKLFQRASVKSLL